MCLIIISFFFVTTPNIFSSVYVVVMPLMIASWPEGNLLAVYLFIS